MIKRKDKIKEDVNKEGKERRQNSKLNLTKKEGEKTEKQT